MCSVSLVLITRPDHRAAREALKTDVTLEPYEQVQSASSDVWNVISRLFGEWPAVSALARVVVRHAVNYNIW
jgi:hypothetical protein